MNIAYVRVSTADQNEARQIECLKRYQIEKWFIEKISASSTNRPKLQEMLSFVREGDCIFIHDFSRMARNTGDLMQLIDQLQERGIQLVSCKESIDTSTATGKLMLTVLAAINEFERSILLERQREGIALAKERGEYHGRKRIEPPPDFPTLVQQLRNGELTKTELANQMGVSRPTLNRLLQEESQAVKSRSGRIPASENTGG